MISHFLIIALTVDMSTEFFSQYLRRENRLNMLLSFYLLLYDFLDSARYYQKLRILC